MPDPLPSTFAENAVRDIRLIAHDYGAARAASTRTTSVGRFGGPDAGFGDRATQLAVANLVGVVEQYAEQVLLNAGSDAKRVRTWDDKCREWKRVFGVDIEAPDVCPSFAPIRGYYEARNSIMHQRGELTHSQRKKDVYDRLAAARMERVGFQIVVTESTVRTCADACVRCINELDGSTLTQNEIYE